MEPHTLPAPIHDFLEAQRRLVEWAVAQDPPDRRVFEAALFPPLLPIGHMREIVREAVREAVPRVECRLSSADAGMMRLLVAPGETRTGIRYLREFTKEAQRLTVLDPYAFAREPDEVELAIDAFANATSLRKNKLKALHIVHRPLRRGARGEGDRAVMHAIKNLSGKNRITFSHHETRVIHDRVWIADGKRAVAVGTSLNGLGTKAAFILDLPEDDLRELQGFLRERGFIP